MQRLEEVIIKIFGIEAIKKIKYFLSFIYYKDFKKYKNKKKIIHIQIPLHGNMGDQAIIYATNKYLKRKFKDYIIIEIYKKDIYKYAKAIKMILKKDDIIVLIGGGNMGNLWIKEEQERRFIIKTYKDSKIISMPQTIDFTNDDDGRKELAISKEVYNSNKNLMLIAREKKSYEIMKKTFNNVKVILNPDMVFFLNSLFNGNEYKRSYIMTCFRNDKESVLHDNGQKFIEKLKNNYGNIISTDTVLSKNITREIREDELKKVLDKFLKAKVVITDRLHGMIFATITKTPCIVTKSFDFKINETYRWIQDLNYIYFIDKLEFEDVKPQIDKFINIKPRSDINFDEKYFDELYNLIKGAVSE